MKSIKRNIILFFFLFVVSNQYSQTTTQPTPLSGSTSISFDGSTYTFNAVGVTYQYVVVGDVGIRGSLINLTAIKNGVTFYPSYFGGVAANFNGTSLKPWQLPSDLGYTKIDNYQIGNEVTVIWKMYSINTPSNYCQYKYVFSISGQTLIIKIVGLTNTDNIESVGFNQAFTHTPSNQTMRVINIPCLPIMNVLYNSNMQAFATLYTDWESTNSSGIIAWNGGTPSTSRFYSQRIDYEKKIDGYRNPLNETIYLSVASDLKDVIPSIVGSQAPNTNTMWNKIVISYFKPFPYLLRDIAYYGANVNYSYLQDLYQNYGVRDASFIIKNWGNGQFDDHYPTTWPPDAFTENKGFGTPGNDPGFPSTYLGNQGLQNVSAALQTRGYNFALHENYTDYYPYPGPHSFGKLPNGDSARAFLHIYTVPIPSKQSYLLRPSTVAVPVGVASIETQNIKSGLTTNFSPNWSYLDVSTGINPSGQLVTKELYHSTDSGNNWSYVDFSFDGKFKSTVDAYRNLASTIRSSYNGPVEGEGGYHFLYAGYFDDFEGRLQTGSSLEGYNAPIIIEFSKKIREKSAIHGVGHVQWFFGGNNNLNEKQIKTFMATELAYGHAALVTSAPGGVSVNTDIIVSRLHAQWAQQYIRWVQQLYATAQPVSITYYNGSGSQIGDASSYIKTYSNVFDDIENSNFMGRVKVVYDNGLQIRVNRNPYNDWQIPFSGSGGFYCYNVKVNGVETMGTSWAQPSSLILPMDSGWLVYSPTVYPTFSKEGNDKPNNITEIPNIFELSQNYPNPFNPETIISFSVPGKSFVTLKIYDVLGREVAELVNDYKEIGNYKVKLDGSKLASGIYFYKLTAGINNSVKKMLLVK